MKRRNSHHNSHRYQDDPGEYWIRTRQPLTCLAFLAPLLIAYEVGVFWVGGTDPEAVRNGADFWMRGWLGELGMQQALLLPALVGGALFAWHLLGRYPWRISFDALTGMFGESILFAFVLVVWGQFQDYLFERLDAADTLVIGGHAAAARVITFIGAGVYEEVLFRLCLLPACYLLFRLALLPNRWAAVLAILSTSLMFSLAHYIGAGAEQFALFSFTFRACAGLFFAVLFYVRGFGIAVGCHAAYDVLVGVILEPVW